MFGKKQTSPLSVHAITERIEREKQAAIDAPKNEAPVPAGRMLWLCDTAPGELTTVQAHLAMQAHLRCGVDTCLVRRRARATLVTAGHMVLDPRATNPVAKSRRPLSTWLRIAVFNCGATFLGGRHALR
ncbi:hypothetical protein [Nocardia otitidiscaviarum]|uniref:hypothetical protein n=1 Tax=Nocardia otitidiscaviarum TaxID=1823 RepID=UPI00189627E5|nr:hypothetical protein [Nocardia otitidiscaviarum]MBF6183519.1 hypothetical protein [Nocardia otitidiscaviarum]